MKQLLFLFLLPCLAWAQYPSNGNQKITLGEQTTADGLIWRGVAADTTTTVKSDTAAYFVLDTANINLYTYKASATGRKWRQLGADTAAIAYVNTYGTQTVNGAKTFTSTITGARFDPTSSSTSGTGMYLPSSGKLGFSVSGTQKMNLVSNGVGYGTDLFAWISGISFTLDFPQFAISSGANGGGLISSNFYINESNQRVYKTTNGASFINTQGGAIALSTAPSGTINTVATFNPISLYIASDGNVGIGTTSPTEALHVVGDGLFTGNVGIGSATPTTSGSGITFPATQSASTNVNTLDDYEEGTWTTTFGVQGNLTGTPSLSSAIYRKIGQIVYIEGRVSGLTITTSNTNTYIVFSVPIPMNNNSTSQTGNVYTYTGSTDITGVITDNTNGDNTTVAIIIPNALVTAGSLSNLVFSITYIANN